MHDGSPTPIEMHSLTDATIPSLCALMHRIACSRDSSDHPQRAQCNVVACDVRALVFATSSSVHRQRYRSIAAVLRPLLQTACEDSTVIAGSELELRTAQRSAASTRCDENERAATDERTRQRTVMQHLQRFNSDQHANSQSQPTRHSSCLLVALA